MFVTNILDTSLFLLYCTLSLSNCTFSQAGEDTFNFCAGQETSCHDYLLSTEPIVKGKQTVTCIINCSYDPQLYRGVFNKPIILVYITTESRDMDTDIP